MKWGRAKHTHNEKLNKKTCEFKAMGHRDKDNLGPSMPGAISKFLCGSTDAQVRTHFDEEDLNTENMDIRGAAQMHWIEIQRCRLHRRRIAHNMKTIRSSKGAKHYWSRSLLRQLFPYLAVRQMLFTGGSIQAS